MFLRKKAILFVHGFVGGIYDYDNFPNLLELYKKFDVFTFTLPGHDKLIVKNVKYTDWIKEAEKQVKFLIDNHYKEIYVIGHSMGGVIAAHLAKEFKEVKKLVMVAPAFRYFCFTDGKVNIKNISNTLKSMPDLIKKMGAETVLERISKTPITTMLEFTKLVNKYESDIKEITCPTLTIHGIDDTVVPKEATDYIFNNIKSKTNILINIKSVNHDCFRRKRNDEIKNIITKFLLKRTHSIKKEFNI